MRFDLICPYIFVQKGGKKKRQLDGFLHWRWQLVDGHTSFLSDRESYQTASKLHIQSRMVNHPFAEISSTKPLNFPLTQNYLTSPKPFWVSKIHQKKPCLLDVVWVSLLKAEVSSENCFWCLQRCALAASPWVFVELFHTQNQLDCCVSCISSPRVVLPIGLFMGCTYIARVEKLPMVMVMKPK